MNGGVNLNLPPEHQATYDKLAGVVIQALGVEGVINNAVNALGGPMKAMLDPEISGLMAHIAKEVKAAQATGDEASEKLAAAAAKVVKRQKAQAAKAVPKGKPDAKAPAKPQPKKEA